MLPDYAIPSFYVALDSLPRNSNGKIDRASLPRPGSERPTLNVDYVQAQSLVQLQLIQIWEQILKIYPIGIRDDFFDLGGDSLSVLNMLLQANEDFGVELHVSALLPSATVEQLAILIQSQGERLCKPVIEIQAGRSGPPLFYLHGDYISGGFYCLKLADHLDKAIPFYVLPPCGVDGGDVPSSYGIMADRHLEVLRQIQPEGPYYLGGTCNGGIIAYEIARRLESQGEEVALLAMFFASAANQRFLPLFRFVSAIGRFFRYLEEQKLAAFLRLREITINIKSHTMSQQISYVLRKTALIPRELLRLVRPVGTQWTKACSHEDMSTIYHAVDHLYIPESYAGKVTLLWPMREPESAEQAAAEWRRVAGDVELHTLASSHHDCLTKDVDLLAKELSAGYVGAG